MIELNDVEVEIVKLGLPSYIHDLWFEIENLNSEDEDALEQLEKLVGKLRAAQNLLTRTENNSDQFLKDITDSILKVKQEPYVGKGDYPGFPNWSPDPKDWLSSKEPLLNHTINVIKITEPINLDKPAPYFGKYD